MSNILVILVNNDALSTRNQKLLCSMQHQHLIIDDLLGLSDQL